MYSKKDTLHRKIYDDRAGKPTNTTKVYKFLAPALAVVDTRPKLSKLVNKQKNHRDITEPSPEARTQSDC